MTGLVGIGELRERIGPTSADDATLRAVLDEAHAELVADTRLPVARIAVVPEAAALAVGEVVRRAQNLLARGNSPEGVLGVGELGPVPVPAGPPGSARTVQRIRRLVLGFCPAGAA